MNHADGPYLPLDSSVRCDRLTSKAEVMPGTDSQRSWPEVGFWDISMC